MSDSPTNYIPVPFVERQTPFLPNGSTELEKKVAVILREATENPINIADLINPDRCPPKFLPYLAWALSVDRWDDNWEEATKRWVIKASYFIHRHKGTINAIRRVVEPIGYLVDVREWFDSSPQEEPGTFNLTVEVSENGLNEQTYNELVRLINDVKPVSRQYGLAITVSPIGAINVFIGQHLAEVIEVYPK